MANQWDQSRVPGQRRQKVLGYIKAANELRQSYAQSLSTKWEERGFDEGVPGAFPETDIVRTGEEEMLLFPSYARHYRKATHPSQGMHMPGVNEDINNPDPGDADYWRREWEKYEDANAVVDVDVRGWIYTPQRGPLNRRNRLMLAVARRLSGIPAPDISPSHSRESSQTRPWRDRVHDDVAGQEEEVAAREAEMIAKHGQREAEAAARGRYTMDNDSLLDVSPSESRSTSPSSVARQRDEGLVPPSKRQSWNLSGPMSRDEVLAANEQLMTRLRPFMTNPLANTPITIFFYNDRKSQSKSVYTDDSGHFKVRAALDFVPDKVRVLASETLSATEDVIVLNSKGVSIVSDIDDTIKHSAIASGAKEIFKNTFIKDLGELTVPGVREWYSKMAKLGVTMHYVSNSPWQLYPLLERYFELAGLPPGSFHLKQYSGMLQGIFEPAAERKKGSLDRIMHDFPERKFILIGDSGEADLEVYTDIVQEHPGRILAVFIRDVTSKEGSELKNFFHGSTPDLHSSNNPRSSYSSNNDTPKSRTPSSASDGWAPALPERPKPQRHASENLIDFDEIPSPAQSSSNGPTGPQPNGKQPPTKPAKPSNLRSISTTSPPQKFAPPIPPPRRTNTASTLGSQTSRSTTSQNLQPTNNPSPSNSGSSTPNSATTPVGERFYASRTPTQTQTPQQRTLWQDSSHYPSRPQQEGYLASARHQLTNVYNALPAIRPQHSGSSQRGGSFPAAAARFVTGATGGDPNAGGDGGAPGQNYDRKLEMWKRRWARSEDILGRSGVVLKTWKNGTDVMGLCERMVKEELKRVDDEKNG